MIEKGMGLDRGVASLVASGSLDSERLDVAGRYIIECRAINGALRWREEIDNLLTTQGRNHILDTYLAGSAYTASFNLSLYTAGTAVATATYAAPVVTEVTSGVLAARPAPTWNAASAGSKASNTIACSIVGTATITGVMMVKGSATIGDTAAAGGVMLSQAALGTSRGVQSGDTLNVTYTLTV